MKGREMRPVKVIVRPPSKGILDDFVYLDMKTDIPMLNLFSAFRILEKDHPECGSTFCCWLVDRGYAKYSSNPVEVFDFPKSMKDS